MNLRGEPDYADQVPRRFAYEAAHPDVQITCGGAWWQAVIPSPDGQMILTRHDLRSLLDKLESLAGEQPRPDPRKDNSS